jgi:hypothetical protein
MTVSEQTTEYHFSDTAAVHAIEAGLDLNSVIAALNAGHYKQPAKEIGVFHHYVKLDGHPAKVSTAPHFQLLDVQSIIGIHLLDKDRS